MPEPMPEPWLRGTLTDLDAVRRQVLHALELAVEDADRWCSNLTDEQINAHPHHLPSIAFQLRHITRSLDRLLTYAEGRTLSESQLSQLQTELHEHSTATALLLQFHESLATATSRIRAFDPSTYEAARTVGRAHLPSTVGALLIHCAEHTQRHIGQLVTTAKVINTP